MPKKERENRDASGYKMCLKAEKTTTRNYQVKMFSLLTFLV